MGDQPKDEGKDISGEVLQAELVRLYAELDDYKKRAEEMALAGHEMIATQARMQSLLHNATEGIISFEKDGRVQTFNLAAQRIFGYSEGEVLGRGISDLIPVHDRDRGNVAQYLREFMATRATDDTPVVGRHKNGASIFLQVSTGESAAGDTELFGDDPFFEIGADEPGGDDVLVCFLHDVTRDKALERKLKQHAEALEREISERRQYEEAIAYENRLDAVLSQLLMVPLGRRSLEDCLGDALNVILSAPFSALLPKGGVFLTNPEGDGLELVVNRNLAPQILQRCAQVSMGTCLCGRAAASRQVVHSQHVDGAHEIQYTGMHDHGHYAVPIFSEYKVLGVLVLYLPSGHAQHGQEISFLESVALVLASIIERKQAEHRLILSKDLAEAANHAKSEFLANMSHELRTPLHAILSFSSLGNKKLESAALKKLGGYFSRIHESGSRLLLLLNDLLDLSKLEAGRMEINATETELAMVVESCLAEQEARLLETGLTVDHQVEGVDTRVLVDPVRIGQVIANLLSNSIKFTPEGKTITIRYEPDYLVAGRRASDVGKVPALRCSVTDEGVGIPEEELESVFDKFIQSSKTKSGAGGTGLGLAICKEIVEAHGGRIWAESPADGGAAFVFVLPREGVSWDVVAD